MIAGDFNAFKICWSFSSAPTTMFDFALEMHAEGWTRNVTMPTRFHNILGLFFKNRTLNVKVSVLENIPWERVRLSFPWHTFFPMCADPTVTWPAEWGRRPLSKTLFTNENLSIPITQHKIEMTSGVCQLQVKHFRAQNIFKNRENSRS